MGEMELRRHRCCFTGHRPEKIKVPEAVVFGNLRSQILSAVDDGFQTFISGMARGVDIWAAECVLELRDKGVPIRLICACPFQGFEASWSVRWQDQYWRVLKKADLVRFICSGYSRDCYQKRNKWMVDHSARVIAVYNGEPGGTRNTVEYARRCGIPVSLVQDVTP